MMRWRRNLARCVVLMSVAALPACTGDFTTPDDDLLRRNQALVDRVRDLEQRIDEQVLRSEALEKQIAAGDAAAQPPKLAAVKLGRYTGSLDLDGDGRDDVIRIYLRTLDEQGRFLPVKATAVVKAVQIAADADPATIVERHYDHEAFDQAYRTGLTGTHYTLELKLPDETADVPQAEVAVFVTDQTSGNTFSQTKMLAIRRGRPGGDE